MEDYSKSYRKKNRFIFELRYQPLLRILDEKGKIIDDFHKKTVSKFPNWQLVGSDILWTEKPEMPQNELFVGLRRMAFIIEDISTFESYYNDAISYSQFFFDYFKITSFERVGFRIISTYTSTKGSEFDWYLHKIEDKFLKDPLSLGLRHKDLFLKVDHSNGFYVVGPVKQKEQWIMSNFKEIKDLTKIPRSGLGLDIDSYGLNFNVKNGKDFVLKIDATIKLSKSIEDALLKSLEF